MAISTLDTERLVSHCGAAVGQSLRLVTRGASEFLVISIELKPRVLLMVKHELVKVVTIDMALRAVHILGRSELTDVWIPVTRLTVSAGHPGEGALQWVRSGRRCVAIDALGPRVSPTQFVSCPERVIESGCTDLLETFRGVASSTAGISVNDGRQMWLVKLTIMHIDVTGTALGWRPMKHTRLEQSDIGRLRIRIARSIVTGAAGNRSVRTRERKWSLRVLFQGKRRTAKRMFIVTGLTIFSAEWTELKLALVRILVAVLAGCRRAMKDAKQRGFYAWLRVRLVKQ